MSLKGVQQHHRINICERLDPTNFETAYFDVLKPTSIIPTDFEARIISLSRILSRRPVIITFIIFKSYFEPVLVGTVDP